MRKRRGWARGVLAVDKPGAARGFPEPFQRVSERPEPSFGGIFIPLYYNDFLWMVFVMPCFSLFISAISQVVNPLEKVFPDNVSDREQSTRTGPLI